MICRGVRRRNRKFMFQSTVPHLALGELILTLLVTLTGLTALVGRVRTLATGV
jgi:hypothetical protein